MLKSIATVSISGTLDVKLQAIANAGFLGVEIFENDLLGFDGSPRDVRRLLDELGLVCICYQPFRDFEGLPPALRARAFDRAEAKFDLMQELGAELLLVCSSVHPEAQADVARIVDDFRGLGERAARRGLRVGYEALAWGRHVNDHRQAWEIVKQAAHPAIGLILDSFHSLARRIPSSSIADIPGDKIFLVQVADAPDMESNYLYWSRHFRCFPSQGDLPLVDYIRAVARVGYSGPLSLEIFNDRFREWSTARVANDGVRSLAVLLDEVTCVDPMSALERLAPRASILGVDFIEFATSRAEAFALASMLHGLGFVHRGEHRSKDVSLWRQGDVHIVVNRDATGWAHSHWQLHGISICALALKVDDANAALARASALNIDTFEQRVGTGELAIPWIRGVGGALTYFTEPDRGRGHWTRDFVLTHESACPPAGPTPDSLGVTQVDHFSQAVRVEEFLSWQLHYTSLFDVVKLPSVEVSDTRGLVHSQAIESANHAFRVTLNGSSPNQTLAARFLEHEMGAGVQHIALQTKDIFLAARAATANGLAVLPVPDNYYEDLRARFGLADAFIERLRTDHIFYDRDEYGEYFQLYTRAFEKRFFFEIVERRTGYVGYGAANAAVRLAAQARYRVMRVD